MKKTLLALAAATVLATPAFATVIDFEKTGTRSDYNDLHDAIDGFGFNYTMDKIDVSADGPYAANGPAHSGDFAALNNYGGYGEITRADGGTFTFSSLWIKNWFSIGEIGGTIFGLRDGKDRRHQNRRPTGAGFAGAASSQTTEALPELDASPHWLGRAAL